MVLGALRGRWGLWLGVVGLLFACGDDGATSTDSAMSTDDAGSGGSDDQELTEQDTDSVETADETDEVPTDTDESTDGDISDTPAESDTDGETMSDVSDADGGIADPDGTDDDVTDAGAPEREAGVAAEPNVTPELGGTITSDDGLVTLEVPPGAVEQAVAIRIMRADAMAPEEIFEDDVVFAAYDLQPSGLEFEVPALVQVTLTEEEMETTSRGSVGLRTIALQDDDGELDGPDEVVIERDPGGALMLSGEIAHFSWLFVTPVGVEFSLDPTEIDESAPATFSVEATLESSRVLGRLARNMMRKGLPNPPEIRTLVAVKWVTELFPSPAFQTSELLPATVPAGGVSTTTADFECQTPGTGSILAVTDVSLPSPYGAGGGEPENIRIFVSNGEEFALTNLVADIPVECDCGLDEGVCVPGSFDAELCQCIPPPCGNGELDSGEECDPGIAPRCDSSQRLINTAGAFLPPAGSLLCSDECTCVCDLTQEDCGFFGVLNTETCACDVAPSCPESPFTLLMQDASVASDNDPPHASFFNVTGEEFGIQFEPMSGSFESEGVPTRDIVPMLGTMSDTFDGCLLQGSGMGTVASNPDSTCELEDVLLGNGMFSGTYRCCPSGYPCPPNDYIVFDIAGGVEVFGN